MTQQLTELVADSTTVVRRDYAAQRCRRHSVIGHWLYRPLRLPSHHHADDGELQGQHLPVCQRPHTCIA